MVGIERHYRRDVNPGGGIGQVLRAMTNLHRYPGLLQGLRRRRCLLVTASHFTPRDQRHLRYRRDALTAYTHEMQAFRLQGGGKPRPYYTRFQCFRSFAICALIAATSSVACSFASARPASALDSTTVLTVIIAITPP